MTLGADYFDERYAHRDDPWWLAERWYEERKRALTLGILPRARFASALEVGCSIGTLSAELATRCDRLVALDISARAVELARGRLGGAPGATAEVMAVPGDWPSGRFDLVVLSEVGYYLDEQDLAEVVLLSVESLEADGVIVACHWRHPVADYPLSGDRVHEVIAAVSGLRRLGRYLDDDVVLELFDRSSSGSVASREGLV